MRSPAAGERVPRLGSLCLISPVGFHALTPAEIHTCVETVGVVAWPSLEQVRLYVDPWRFDLTASPPAGITS